MANVNVGKEVATLKLQNTGLTFQTSSNAIKI